MSGSHLTAKQHARKLARKFAAKHEHELGTFVEIPHKERLVDHAMCKACGLSVYINAHEDGIGTHIHGPATTTHCMPIAKPRARALTVADLPRLTLGTTLYALYETNSRNEPTRFRVSSQIKRWVREPDRFRFSIKWGLYATYTVTTADQLAQLTLDDPSTHRFGSNELDIGRAALDN